MKEAKIFIGGEQVDLFDRDKLRLALTYSIADINKIESRSSGTSKTITLPATHNNNKIFGFGIDVNSSDALDQNKRRTAHIEVGGTVLLRGFAKINKNIVKNRNNIGQYQVVIIGDNGDWKERLSERNVNELDYSDQDHIYNKTNIDLSETVSTDRDYVYPLINYGAVLGGHPISGNFEVHDVLVEDRFPAFNIKAIFDRMFNGIGVKIDSKFINSDFFKKLYLPFANDLFLHPQSFRDDDLFRVGLSANLTHLLPISDIDDTLLFPNIGNTPDRSLFLIFFDNESGEFFDAGNNFSLNSYTIKNASKQKFEIKVRISFTSPQFVVGIVRIILTKNFIFVADSQTVTFAENSSAITLTIKTDFITVIAGDEMRVQIDISTNSIITTNELTILKNGTFFSNDISLEIFKDTSIELNNLLPDINQLDFVKGIKDLFNLYFVYDTDTRTVSIEPRDEFYKSKAIDWTDKFDKSKDEEITYLNDKLKKKITYRYQDDSNDGWVQQIESENDIIIASNEITNPNKFVKDEQNVGTKLFAPTIMRPFDYIGLLISKVPTLNKDAILHPDISEKSTNFKTRILYFDSIRNTETGESWFFEGIERTDYPYFFSVDVVSDNDNSLYYDNTRRSKGLFNKYYENLHDTLNEGRLYTAFFNLNDSDISNLDFRIPIFVKNTYYLLNKIVNYDPLLKKTTKVELIRATNMNIQAIILEAEGGEGAIFITPSIPEDDKPFSEAEDPTIPPDINEVKKRSLVVSLGQDDTGVVVKGARNHSAFKGTISYGEGLRAAKDDQTLIGSYNEEDKTAQMIMGGGSVSERKTLAKVARDGTVKPSNGSRMVLTVNGVSVDMVYTDLDGETQMVVKTDNR